MFHSLVNTLSLLAILSLATLAQASPTRPASPTPPGDSSPKDVLRHKPLPPRALKDGYSIIPAAAANSTYGLMVGAAAILYKPLQHHHKFTAIAIVTKTQETYGLLDYDRQGKEWSQGIRILSNNFFDPYYGDTRGVRKGEADQILGKSLKIRPYIEYRLASTLGAQFFWDMRNREEKGKLIRANGKTEHIHIFPNEKTHAYGLALVYDDRYEPDFSTLGSYANTRLVYMPGRGATTIPGQKQFTQWTLDLRNYHEITPSFVLAARFYAGTSLGDPTYSYSFSFGGSAEMRGYGFTRFRGKKFYLAQWEGRFPIYKILSGNIFYEAGDITFDRYHSLISDYGMGIKIGLPPNYVAKLRIDVGFGGEGHNFIMEADHAF